MARILVVDDDLEIRAALKECLEAELHKVETASHGGEALAILQNAAGSFDLILTDLAMPVCDGHKFLKLKNMHERLRRIPTIVLTGNRDASRVGGITLQKPLDLDKLSWAISVALPATSKEKQPATCSKIP
jgi:CheY-like chemotaxis protein